ncbi:MAG: hypothetical protein OHK0013_11840 [Sandaracinaceae bacterium]
MTTRLRIVSWNIAHREECWRFLVGKGYDVALLQEASPPPSDLLGRVRVSDAPWALGGVGLRREWRSAVVGLSERVEIRWLPVAPVDGADASTLGVSRSGTLEVAEVVWNGGTEKVCLASLYAAWEAPLGDGERRQIYADASAHRLISDLTALLDSEARPRLVAAGDLNLLRGYGEDGSPLWKARYDTVFARMEAVGVPFVGPELAVGSGPRGRVPAERPADSRTVPTFRTRVADPDSATRQLDFVFASRALRPLVRTRARDAPEEWGPSDHCRIEIELDPS